MNRGVYIWTVSRFLLFWLYSAHCILSETLTEVEVLTFSFLFEGVYTLESLCGKTLTQSPFSFRTMQQHKHTDKATKEFFKPKVSHLSSNQLSIYLNY